MAGKITDKGERKILAAAMAGVGVWTLHLAKATFDPEEEMLPGDFTEADYTGYAPLELTFDELAAGNPGGRAVANFLELLFSCGGPETPNDIYGYWVEDIEGDVVAVEKFAGSPKPMKTAAHEIALPFHLRLFSPL